VISRYRVLFSVPGFARVLISSVLGRLPSGMFSLAILLFVHSQTGSFLPAGLAVGAFTLSGALLSPVQGGLVDRLGQPRVLLPCAFAQSALLIGFVVLVGARPGTVAIVALAALCGAPLPPVSGCVRALWSQLAPDQDALERAYTLDAISQELIYTCGPLLAGGLATLLSPLAAVIGCAVVTLAGTLGFATSEHCRGWRPQAGGVQRGGALASGGLRILLVSVLFAGLVIGAVEVGLPALAVHLHHRSIAGVLLALFSLGSMLGGLLYSARRFRSSAASRYVTVLVLVEFLVAPLMLAHSLTATLLFSAIAGLGVAPMLSLQFSLVGALAPPGATTEAFTWHRGATVAGIAAGSAAGGGLVASMGSAAPFALAATGAALAGAVAALWRSAINGQSAADRRAATVDLSGLSRPESLRRAS
jgi:MFS family permease